MQNNDYNNKAGQNVHFAKEIILTNSLRNWHIQLYSEKCTRRYFKVRDDD